MSKLDYLKHSLLGMPPQIELFVRHCHYSAISQHKNRLPGFDRKKCYENLLKTVDLKRVRITFLLDTFHPLDHEHFIMQQKKFPVIQTRQGSETGSFLFLLDHVIAQKFYPDTIIYLLEDDYLHREGWVDVLLEAFELPVDYVTLFDHRDKYTASSYKDLQARLYQTHSCHFRTTPSTTNTFAARYKTLQKDAPIHRAYSENRTITADHEKFCHLQREGATLISSIPGWSTHVEQEFTSPCFSWESLL